MAGVAREILTLSIQEVVDQDIVTAVRLERGVLEALVGVGAVAHIFLAKALDMFVDVVDVLPCG
jgi:hypothetical protein